MPHAQIKVPSAPLLAFLLTSMIVPGVHSVETHPVDQLHRFVDQAGAPADAVRGQRFFNMRHAGEWSCASCHGSPPLTEGRHASTGKAIPPLAPVSNPKALTDTAKIDKWFTRNCQDVLKRRCTPGEQADVLAYLLSFNGARGDHGPQ